MIFPGFDPISCYLSMDTVSRSKIIIIPFKTFEVDVIRWYLKETISIHVLANEMPDGSCCSFFHTIRGVIH